HTGLRQLVEAARDRADVDERRQSDPLDADRVGERDATWNDPETVLGSRVPGRVAREAVRDVPAQRGVAAEPRAREERQLAGARLHESAEGDGVGGRVFLELIASAVEERRHAEGDVAEHRRDHSGVSPGLPDRGVEEDAHLEPRIGLVLTVARVVPKAGRQDERIVMVRVVEQLRKDLVGGGVIRHFSRCQIVMLAAHTERRDPVVGEPKERKVAPDAEVEDLVGIARLVSLARVRAEAEEPAREALLVAAERIEMVSLLDDHPALRQVAMLEPATPDQAVFLLTLRRVRGERAEKLPAPLLPEVDVGERDAAAGADVALEEELRRHEARYQ